MGEKIEAALAILNYDAKWLAYGFIDGQFLLHQFEQYDKSDNKNTEHYRYAAFCTVLERYSTLDDLLLDRYIELAELDDDRTMADAALVQLVGHPGLSGQQLNHLKAHPTFQSPVIQQRLERSRLLRELQSKDVTDALFELCVTSADAFVQRELLERKDISRAQLEVLYVRGTNRAIRNMAGNKLRLASQ